MTKYLRIKINILKSNKSETKHLPNELNVCVHEKGRKCAEAVKLQQNR